MMFVLGNNLITIYFYFYFIKKTLIFKNKILFLLFYFILKVILVDKKNYFLHCY
jgi:hypothetical protein